MPQFMPTTPGPIKANVRLVSQQNELRSAFDGAIQRLIRLGSRYAIDLEWEPMDYEESLAFIGLRRDADTVVVSVPQPGVEIGSPGTPRVSGGGQLGSTLIVDGVTPGYVLGAGRYLSVITGGQRYLYATAQSATANGSGVITIPLEVPIRFPPSDDDVVEIAEPKIEGFATFGEDLFMVDGNRHVWLRASIEERS